MSATAGEGEHNQASDDKPAGTTSASAAASQRARQPLVRSCLNCHQRRVKCDKGNPCSGCLKSDTTCLYPPPGKLKRRRKRKDHDSELLGRIKELESTVKSLSNISISTETERGSKAGSEDTVSFKDEGTSPRSEFDAATLVVAKEGTQYLSNAFWVKMSEEISELKEAMKASDSDFSDDDEAANTPSVHQAFLLGIPGSTTVTLDQLRPSPQHIFAIWETYKENIDCIVKVLHVPSTKVLMMNAVSNPQGLTKSASALFFAICFGAVLSLGDDQCRDLLGDERESLLKRFRLGTEQALARASFMSNSSLTCLQAFSLYITFLRGLDESKTVWALGSLAGSLAMPVGLHRDGTFFNLKPFDTEMRRRLWWHIWSLSSRSDEDHGLTSAINLETSNDTRMPLNVNDEDLDPNMKTFPEEREGFTTMFLSKVRYETGIWFSQIVRNKDKYKRPQDRDVIVEQYRRLLDDKYMRHCDTRIPIQFLAHSLCRLLITKLWLFFSLPGSISEAAIDSDTPPAVRDQVFETAVEAIEIWISMLGHSEAAQWSWFAPTWMQWQLVCYIMAEIPNRGSGPLTHRAWMGIRDAWSLRHVRPSKTVSSVLWKAVGMLWYRAKAHKAELAKQEKETERQKQAQQAQRAALQQQRAYQSLDSASASFAVLGSTMMDPRSSMQMSPDQTRRSSTEYTSPLMQGQAQSHGISPPMEYASSGTSGPSPQGGAFTSDFELAQDWNEIGALDPTSFGWGHWTPSLGEWDPILGGLAPQEGFQMAPGAAQIYDTGTSTQPMTGGLLQMTQPQQQPDQTQAQLDAANWMMWYQK